MAKSAEELLIYLFDEILPKYGMNLRVKQKELSLEMLRALQENKLALCEAEVGTGKTHAYILALTVHNIYSNRKAPAVISTSTIALQKALTEEYIPQISGILLEHHVIDKPLSFVVRKGKRHYVCDSRLKIYETYRYEKGIVKNEKMKDVLWKTYAIEDMLRDEVYLGNMVRGKTHSAMHKGEKRHHVPRSEWIVVQGTHEPIVSRELFDAVQAVNEKKAQEHKDNLEKAKENPKRDNLFKGKIFCGDCGITMGGTVGNYNSMSYYCPNYRENGAMGCVKKHISARKLEKAVLEAVQIHLKIFLECREEIRSRNGSAEIGKRRMVLESETRDLRQKEAQYQQKLSSTYLDYKDKLLTVQEYFMLKNKYQAALAELEVARKEKELLLNKMQETYGEDLELSHAAEQYFGQMVVTKDMVDALIERIEVFEKGRIHIIFRFEDEYRSLLEKRADME